MAGHTLLCRTTRPFCPREQWTTATSVKLQDVGGQLYAMLDFPSHEEVHRAIVQGPLATELPADAAHPEDPDPEPMDEAMARRGTGRCIAGRASLTPGDLIPLGGGTTQTGQGAEVGAGHGQTRSFRATQGGGSRPATFPQHGFPSYAFFFCAATQSEAASSILPASPNAQSLSCPPPSGSATSRSPEGGSHFTFPGCSFPFLGHDGQRRSVWMEQIASTESKDHLPLPRRCPPRGSWLPPPYMQHADTPLYLAIWL